MKARPAPKLGAQFETQATAHSLPYCLPNEDPPEKPCLLNGFCFCLAAQKKLHNRLHNCPTQLPDKLARMLPSPLLCGLCWHPVPHGLPVHSVPQALPLCLTLPARFWPAGTGDGVEMIPETGGKWWG